MKSCLAELPSINIALGGAGRILIATDFDGTLCPIANSPSEVRLAPATLEVLRLIAGSRGFTLAVISGRALEDIRYRLPLDIIFSGNHGLEISGRGLSFQHAGARELRPVMLAACEALSNAVHGWHGAWVEDKGLSATLHFRRVDEREHNAVLFAARYTLGRFGSQLALRVGNRALEVRPRVFWDKGSALNYILQHAGPFDACICIGDDRTDETMFRANANELNIKVGSVNRTAATHYLADPVEVAIFLSHVVGARNSHAVAEVLMHATF